MLKQTPLVRSLVLKLYSIEDCENSDTAQEKNCDGAPGKRINLLPRFFDRYVSTDSNLVACLYLCVCRYFFLYISISIMLNNGIPTVAK